MKQLSEFATLQEARDYPLTSYRKIGGNEARQFFAITGVLNSIESSQNNSTAATDAQNNINTTVGQLAKAVILTIKDGQFATDPTMDDGALNRAASQLLVNAGVYPQAIHDAFFARSADVNKPYSTTSQYEFDLAKGNEIAKKPLTYQQGWAFITTTADCEKHNPQILKKIGEHYVRVASFSNVEKTGEYKAQVPNGDLYVHDAYGVIQ